jgi:hypothetical protein
MESLGFIDRPDVASTWKTVVETEPATGRHHSGPTGDTIEEAFSNWKPSEVGKGLLEGNIRWAIVIGTLMIAVGLAGIGYWIYQLPAASTDQAISRINVAALDLNNQLDIVRRANDELRAGEFGSSAELYAAEGAARDLFEAAALDSLPLTTRSLAADAASTTLEASRLITDARTFGAALIPVLAFPDLETDSTIITINEAAVSFGEWHSHLEQVRLALPVGTMSEILSELEILSVDLEGMQSRYLDALREDDRRGAIAALELVSHRLAATVSLLRDSMHIVSARVDQHLAAAETALSGLLG